MGLEIGPTFISYPMLQCKKHKSHHNRKFHCRKLDLPVGVQFLWWRFSSPVSHLRRLLSLTLVMLQSKKKNPSWLCFARRCVHSEENGKSAAGREKFGQKWINYAWPQAFIRLWVTPLAQSALQSISIVKSMSRTKTLLYYQKEVASCRSIHFLNFVSVLWLHI